MKQIVFIAVFIVTLHVIVFGQINKRQCPKYEVVGPAGVTNFGNYAVFQLKGDEEFEKLKLSNAWAVSGGEIYAGQGTKILVVSANPLTRVSEYTDIKAATTIEGLPEGCVKTASEIAIIAGEPKPSQVDEYSNNQPGSIKARIDAYLTQLGNNPNDSGTVVIKSNKRESIIKQIQILSRAIYFRRFDLSRISFRINFDRDDETTEYWLLPPGAYFPFTENIININASEYESLRKFFSIKSRTKK